MKALLSLISQEARCPGSVDKILLMQQIQSWLEQRSAAEASLPAARLRAVPDREHPHRVETSGRNDGASPEALAQLLTWYTGTLARWRRSLRSHRPLADIPPADRPRVRQLLINN